MVEKYANMNGPRPAGVEPQVWKWASEYSKHLALCRDFFEGRADAVIEAGKDLYETTNLGAISALDICMQVEAEFPKRVEEFYEQASRHPQGAVIGMMQYIAHVRRNG